MNVSRRDFLRLIGSTAVVLGVDMTTLGRLKEALAATTQPPIIWLQGSLCTGCSVSLLNLTNPGIENVLLDSVALTYHPTLMSAAGDLAISSLDTTRNGEYGDFILVVEGAVPLAENGGYCVIGERDGEPLTMLQAVSELAPKAKHVISVGTCAAFGGVPAKSAYTDTRELHHVIHHYLKLKLRNPLVNLPGCPAHPNTILGTLVKLLTAQPLDLDEQSRPREFYTTTVHHKCPRHMAPHTDIGVYGCYLHKGCKGPWSVINCPVHKWNNGVNWCVATDTACIGCAAPDFPTNPLFIYGSATEMNHDMDHAMDSATCELGGDGSGMTEPDTTIGTMPGGVGEGSMPTTPTPTPVGNTPPAPPAPSVDTTPVTDPTHIH